MAFLIARINLLIFFSEQCLPQSFAATLIVKKSPMLGCCTLKVQHRKQNTTINSAKNVANNIESTYESFSLYTLMSDYSKIAVNSYSTTVCNNRHARIK